MADVFKGLTLRIGADARPLKSAINSITKSAGDANTQFNRLSKALKFDTANVRAMESRLDLAGDKAAMAATAARKISAAIEQASSKTVEFSARSGLASGKMKDLAANTDKVFAAVNKLRQEYNHVDAELERIYNAASKLYAEQNKISFDKAKKHVQELARDMETSADAARELRSLIQKATMGSDNDLRKQFGMDGINNVVASWKIAKEVLDRLRAAHRDFKSDLEAMKSVEGYRTAQIQLVAYESELRQATEEAARFRAEMYSIGGVSGLDAAVADARRLDAAIDAAATSSKNMAEAFKQAPMSIEAARAKATAFITEQNAIKSKLEAVEALIEKIGSSNGFDRQKAQLTDVWTAAEKAKGAYADIDAKLQKLEAQYNDVEFSIKEAEKAEESLSAEAKRDLSSNRAQLDQLAERIVKVKQELRDADSVVKSTALDVKFREASEEAVQLRARLQQINDQLKRVKNYQAGFENLRRIGYGLYTTLTQAMMRVGRYAIQSAEEIDSAYRDMRKTVNGTEEQFESLKDAALEFSRTHVTSADQILEIEAIGGQLGIAATSLGQFGETVANLDIATNMNAEDIALNLAKLSNIMHFGQESYDSFADALVRLGNNEPALESDIMQISTRFAGMAANVGMATSDVLAFATAATATGQKAAAAGGAMQRTLGRIEKAVDSGGEALEKYARIADVSAEEFATTWGDTENHGPARAMQLFIEGLKRIKESGGSVTNTLADIGITGVRDMQLLAGLTNTTDVLADSMKMAGDAWEGTATVMRDGTIERAGDAAREAGRKAEGFSGQLAIMQNNAQMLANEIAEGATPIIKMFSDVLQGLTQAFMAMPDGVKTAIVAIGGISAAIGPVIVGLGAMGSAVTGIGEAFAKIRSFGLLKDAAKDVSSLVSSFRLTGEAAKAASVQMMVSEGVTQKTIGSMTVATSAANTYGKALAAPGTSAAAAAAKSTGLKAAITGLTGSFAASVAAIAGVAVVIGLVAKGFMDQKQRADDAKAATNGWADAITATTPGIANARRDLDLYNSSIEASWRGVEELVQASLHLKDAITERNDAAQNEISRLETAQAVMHKYQRQTSHTAEEMGEFAAAVDTVNELCGTQIEISDLATGMLKDEQGQLLENLDAIDQYIAKKQLQIKADTLIADLQDVTSQKEDAARDLASYKKELSDVNSEIDRLEEKKKSQGGFLAPSDLEDLETARVEQKRLTQEVETAQGVYDETDKAAEHYKKQLGDLYGVIENGTNSLSDYITANSEWAAVFEGASADLDLFKDAIDSTALTTEELGDISGEQIQRIAELWRDFGDSMTIEEILREAGVQVGTFGEQFAAEMQKVGLDFNAMAAMLGTDGETLAQTLRDLGYSAVDFAGISQEAFNTALNAAANAANEGLDPVQAFIDKLQEISQVDVTTEAEFESDEAEGDIDEYEEYLDEVPDEVTTEVEAETEEAQEDLIQYCKTADEVPEEKQTEVQAEIDKATDSIISVTDLIKRIPNANPTVSVDDDATWRINAISRTLSAITTATHLIRLSAVDNASGAISSYGVGHARGGIFDKMLEAIPMNASGAINGIVTRPTLTNIGWVGEAGAEAVMHMRNAGGAVVPLTNARYVRPFARAVASEMGASHGNVFNVNLSLDYKAGDDAQAMARDIARELENLVSMEA